MDSSSRSARSSARASSRLQHGSSSSSSSSSSQRTAEGKGERKRIVPDEDENEAPKNDTPEVEIVGEEQEPPAESTKKYDVDSFVFSKTAKDVEKFEKLSPAVQGQCIKAVCRLFIMKGTMLKYSFIHSSYSVVRRAQGDHQQVHSHKDS